jgi:serpin B
MNAARLISGALLSGILACCGLLTFAQSAVAQPDPSGNVSFALDLYHRLAPARGNFFFSPWSIRSALGMAYAGARTETGAGMMRALHDPVGQSRFHVESARLDRDLLSKGGRREFEVRAANAIWIARDLALEAAFSDTLKSRYSSAPHRIDFASAAVARETINSWVSEQTKGKIRDLIPRGSLNRDTRLVLTNAVYFRAAWQEPFDSSATSPAPFRGWDRVTSRIPFMHMDRTLRIYDGPSVQVLELPYDGGSMAMLAILPREPGDVRDLEGTLTADSLVSWDSRLRSTLVRVALPRFRIETGYELASALGAMGMKLAFTPEADFSGISRERRLSLSGAFHKAYVQVDERGTEAAAATGLEMKQSLAIVPTPVRFIADHPFLFVIRSRASGAILFMGRMADPT